MIVGFTGTRDGCTQEQLYKLGILLRVLVGKAERIEEWHHGACLGADEEATIMIHQLAVRIVAHPSNLAKMTSAVARGLSDEVLEEQSPLVMNGDIVKASDILIACPKEPTESLRSGTWSTVRAARKKGIPIWLIRPDGTVEKEEA